jgi:uncharacterized BrkB/YihY/UPF0761 family membrane protein
MEKFQSTLAVVGDEFKVRASHYIIGGLSLVTALSWNEAIKAYINKVYPLQRDSAAALVLYAVIMTLFVILVVYMLPDTVTLLPDAVKTKIENIKQSSSN